MTFTPEQTKQLSAKLEVAHVKQRQQGSGKVSFIEGWHAIAEANRIFGFGEWDRETVEFRFLYERECRIGKGQYEKDGWRVAYIAKVRVRVRAGETEIIREGCGYGSGIDADLGAAHESALKEAETDAMKRGLMTFGNPFGLALYDKAQENVERGGGSANDAAGSKAAQRPAAPKRVEEFFQRQSYEIDPTKCGGLSKWETYYRQTMQACKTQDEQVKLERDNAGHKAKFGETARPEVVESLRQFENEMFQRFNPMAAE
jgi:DNA recombination protein Rad52